MTARLTIGGLSRIEPVAFLNILRVYIINQGTVGWRNWRVKDLIPPIRVDEWAEITRVTSVF